MDRVCLGLGWVEGGFLGDGLGDLLRELVEVPEVVFPVGVVGGYATIRVCRGMTAFIHYKIQTLSFSLCFCFSGASALVFLWWADRKSVV